MSDVESVSPPITFAERMGLYGKAFAGAVVSALSAYSAAVHDGPGVTSSEWIAVVLSFLASFGIIWLVPQTPRVVATYGKLLFAGLAAAGSSLVTGLTDGSLDQTEIITAVVAFLLASGLTGTVSNAAASDPVDSEGHLVAVPGHVKAAVVSRSTAILNHNGRRITLADSE